MSQIIPAEYRDLFNKRAFASLGTVRPNGSPRVTPVWCDLDGEFVGEKKTRPGLDAGIG